ncbi:MAG: hypothetical protein LBK58_02075 [Prevotellaceae bacterium]|jgi:hypothetical protein|nr:hypothetical protein [Prevotellaceae bacterium]
MKIIDIVSFNRELLGRIRDTGIRLDDCMYIDMYNEFQLMHAEGEKITYIVAVLAEKYSISERKIYYLIKRLNSDCK